MRDGRKPSSRDGRKPVARGRRKARLRRLLLLAIGVLYASSIPWYREGGEAPRVWLGLPDWVAVALGCYVAVALLNATAWLLTDVEDPPSADGAPPA